ncbi:hypothetical protein GCM10010994_60410 [Chelatococcus reniformis]|uniref:Uncharacterized protein n=1 Tax=Chelatococcus reniformis TaxID=1494448 RepID=A0A916V0G9_9HYPH|nr:hypothetical protein GCM10010994_60410 [Chelatococcus reniformis]
MGVRFGSAAAAPRGGEGAAFVEIVSRSEDQKGLQLLSQRRVLKRTFGWTISTMKAHRRLPRHDPRRHGGILIRRNADPRTSKEALRRRARTMCAAGRFAEGGKRKPVAPHAAAAMRRYR